MIGQPYCRSKSDNEDKRSRKNREKLDLCKRRGKKTGKCRNGTGRKKERNNGSKVKATKKSRTFSKTEGRRRNVRSTKCLETRLSKSSPLWYFGWNVLDTKSPEKRTAAQLVKSQCRFVPSTFFSEVFILQGEFNQEDRVCRCKKISIDVCLWRLWLRKPQRMLFLVLFLIII